MTVRRVTKVDKISPSVKMCECWSFLLVHGACRVVLKEGLQG